ncbi:MAG: fimbrial assembly protein FimA [SAR116 cluster bacterium MED-G06]|nr:MAG: fimbrial assembly protein FimA [SAR116 cluster bacterium MED-G06]
MTFSLVARCAASGHFGVAVTSSSPAVAARCAFVRAGTGAVASQNVTDPRLGPRVLDTMASGQGAAAAVGQVTDTADNTGWRQLLAVDAQGGTAIFSGDHALGISAEGQAQDAASAGNLLANPGVPAAVLAGFASSSGHLGDRLMAALFAGLDAGGEAGPLHSAGMLIAGEQSWPLVDLRCDWSEACPIRALDAAWQVYRPQMDDYVIRALDPAASPSYGVAGDDR